MKKRRIYFFFVLFISFTACEKIESVNPVPSISFQEFKLERTYFLGNYGWEGTLLFEFEDDDGGDLSDIFQKDTIDTIFSIHFTRFFKINGEYQVDPLDTLNFHLAYQDDSYDEIKKEGQNKTLKGDWTIRILYTEKPSDTIRYEFYMIDRQGNKSNVEVTTDIAFTE